MSPPKNFLSGTLSHDIKLQSLLWDVKEKKSREFWVQSFKFFLLLIVATVGAMVAMTLWNVTNWNNVLSLIGVLFVTLLFVIISLLINVSLSLTFLLFVWANVKKVRKRTMLALIQTALETQTPISEMVRMYAFSCFSPMYAKNLNCFAAMLEQGKTLPQALSVETELLRYDAAGIIQLGSGEKGTLGLLQQIGDNEKNGEYFHSLILTRFCYLLSLAVPVAMIVVFIMFWILPQFQKIFEDFGITLPYMTQVVIAFGALFRNFWFVCVPFAIAATLFLGMFLILMTDIVVWRPFGFRCIFRGVDSGKLLRMLGVAVSKNIPIPQTLTTYCRITPSPYLSGKAVCIKKKIVLGMSWITALRKAKYVTKAEAEQLETAERTGNLAAVLARISGRRELMQITKVDFYGKLVFSACLLLFGTAIGAFVISLFMPLIELINTLSVV
ncbi:MAG: type II secretion system F family protein [Planctomycetaceae bacterium]|jgi:type II secretory pathway component PulF|nr:type II secretion system F family protein [Planctomycetaceae bacterium]